MFNLGGPRARRHKARLIGNGKRISVFSRGLGNGQNAWIERQLFFRGRNAAVSPICAVTAPDPDSCYRSPTIKSASAESRRAAFGIARGSGSYLQMGGKLKVCFGTPWRETLAWRCGAVYADVMPPTVVFDSDCVLCSQWVHLILRHERRRDIFFIGAWSERGSALALDQARQCRQPTTIATRQIVSDNQDLQAIDGWVVLKALRSSTILR